MAVALLLASREVEQPIVGPEAAERLAGLGISGISLLRDSSGIGVVVEGWAFDPAHINEAIRTMFPDPTADIRIFHEIERVAVSAVSAERRG